MTGRGRNMGGTMSHEKTLARIAGILYLVIFVCAGFAEGYVRSSLIVPGNAAATAARITASQSLYRLGFAADLTAFMCDLAVTVLLYSLLRPAGQTLSLMAAGFRLLARPAIATINLLNHIIVLPILGGADVLSAFTQPQRDALAMIFLDAQHYGYLIAGALFGVHCLLLGVLLVRSDRFPGVLGVFMVIASTGYLIARQVS